MNAPDLSTPERRALTREVSLAAQVLCSGLTALRKAEMTRTGTYYEAFFALSIGFERLCKIAIILDYAIDHDGAFPTDKRLKNIGHDLERLLCESRRIRAKHPITDHLSMFPEDAAVTRIISFLSAFAQTTRYYNLDFLHQTSEDSDDPLRAWNDLVGSEILGNHYTQRMREKHEATAQALNDKTDQSTYVYFSTGDGTLITNVKSLFLHQRRMEVIQQWSQYYALKVSRFLALLIADLENQAKQPYLTEFLWPFRTDDSYLKRHRVWTIYH